MYTAPSAHKPRTAAIQDAEDLCRQYPNKCSSWLTLYKAKAKADLFYKPDYEFEQMKNRCDDFAGFYREAEEAADRIIGKSVSDFVSAFFSKILKTVLIALGSCVSLAGAFLFAVLGTEGLKTIGFILIGVAVLLAIFFVMKIVSLKAPRNKLVIKIFFELLEKAPIV